jgi:hypothetical protein
MTYMSLHFPCVKFAINVDSVDNRNSHSVKGATQLTIQQDSA